MGKLVRRFWSCETGSALTEYGVIIAFVALGLTAMLTTFRNSVGDLANRTAVTISDQSSQGYGAGSDVGVPPPSITPVEADPAAPDSSGSDSTGAAAGLQTGTLRGD